MEPVDVTQAIRAFSALRVVLGAVLFFAPAGVGRLWLGRTVTESGAARTAVRSMAARDALLGVGALLALREKAPVRGWLEASAGADLADVVSSLVAGRALPRAGRTLVPVFGLAGAAAGAWLARRASQVTP